MKRMKYLNEMFIANETYGRKNETFWDLIKKYYLIRGMHYFRQNMPYYTVQFEVLLNILELDIQLYDQNATYVILNEGQE